MTVLISCTDFFHAFVLDLVANAARQVLNSITGFKQLPYMFVINVEAWVLKSIWTNLLIAELIKKIPF